MISKEMYELMKQIPRHKEGISFKEIKCEDEEKKVDLLCEALHAHQYISKLGDTVKSGLMSLTEKGQAAIEEYERAEHNQKVVERSLRVSRIAMWAAIGSAVAAFFSFIKLFL